MKDNAINPVVGWSIVAVLVVLAVVGFFYFTNPKPDQVDLTKISKEDLEDRDPPKRGQPGYRERITDPPAP
ncbi:MAG TPA: hypothetical protein PLX06_13180 [Fimbriimonadaceae bacterium]|nr:hypothetical protein [Fimbriimonadaceae bacterium]